MSGYGPPRGWRGSNAWGTASPQRTEEPMSETETAPTTNGEHAMGEPEVLGQYAPRETRRAVIAMLTEVFHGVDGDGGPLLTTEDARCLALAATSALLSSGPWMVVDRKFYKPVAVESYDIDDEGWRWRVTLPWGSWRNDDADRNETGDDDE